jgi:hypothetical protein
VRYIDTLRPAADVPALTHDIKMILSSGIFVPADAKLVRSFPCDVVVLPLDIVNVGVELLMFAPPTVILRVVAVEPAVTRDARTLVSFHAPVARKLTSAPAAKVPVSLVQGIITTVGNPITAVSEILIFVVLIVPMFESVTPFILTVAAVYAAMPPNVTVPEAAMLVP